MFSIANSPLVRGLLKGLAAPVAAFNPPPVHTTVDEWVKTPSYRPWSEDLKNIGQDFGKVIGSVNKEISAAENGRREREGYDGW